MLLITGISSSQMFTSVELVSSDARLHFIIVTAVCVHPLLGNSPAGHDGSFHGAAANESMDSMN